MEANWRQECARLHIELDSVRAEMLEWKTKFERLMLYKEQPRLPVRGLRQWDIGRGMMVNDR